MSKLYKYFMLLAAIAVPLLSSCRDDDDEDSQSQETVTYKVAVIMPGSQQERWSNVAEWALENLKAGQQRTKYLKKIIQLELEWYDEDDTSGLVDFVRRVEADPEYKAIIGPLRTENAYTVATLCEKHHKTLILPQCTSTEVQRVFAESPNVFNLTQSDIGQAEVLVSIALQRHAPSISLLVHSGDPTTAEAQRSYGATFRNWVGFLACEAGLEVDTVCTYDDSQSLEHAVKGLADFYNARFKETDDDWFSKSVLLFVPEKPEELEEYDRIVNNSVSIETRLFTYPFTLCSNMAVGDNYFNTGTFKTQYEGVDISPSTTTGFLPAYHAQFGSYNFPIGGEPQLFDALYMLTYALAYNPDDVNGSITTICDTKSQGYSMSWMPFEIGVAMLLFQSGATTPISGVMGRWQFDERYHASLLNTTYRHWRMTKETGTLATLQYISLAGGKRSISNEQLWRMNAKVTDDFSEYTDDISYAEQEGNYAVIVAASTGWHNYRHQADALNMYQMLKQHGYDDDHILLIMEGDIVNDEHNLHPGEVRVRPDGVNLYKDVKIDYRTSTLLPADLTNIMAGKVTERTPTVLPSTNKDNVFVFWSGHGNEGVFYLDRYNFMKEQMLTTLYTMRGDQKYRKLFFVIEACYSGSVAEYCEGVPGVLMLTAANDAETSLADVLDPEMNIWLSNGFTRSFCEAVEKNNNISMRDLYYYVAQQTVGSHATMYNYEMYGNMFTNTVKEFLP